MFVGNEQAKELAAEEIKLSQIRKEPIFTPWREASLGTPVLVRNLFKEPSYWLVPVLRHGQVIGFVRVLGSGKVAHIGTFYQDPSKIEGPTTITGIESTEASRKAVERIHRDQGESALDPIFVHDGPVGREAWLIEVVKDHIPIRWIFVTPGFVYERPAGEMLDEALE
jgi:hypothetical protein